MMSEAEKTSMELCRRLAEAAKTAPSASEVDEYLRRVKSDDE